MPPPKSLPRLCCRIAGVLAVEAIASHIVILRGQRLIVDADLAALYGVPTKRLNEQVRRTAERFLVDFMFALSQEGWDALRSQSATLKTGRGQHRKYLPFAFTEHGAIMVATVLNSPPSLRIVPGIAVPLASTL